MSARDGTTPTFSQDLRIISLYGLLETSMAATSVESKVTEAGNGEPSSNPTVSDEDKKKAEELKEKANDFFKSNGHDFVLFTRSFYNILAGFACEADGFDRSINMAHAAKVFRDILSAVTIPFRLPPFLAIGSFKWNINNLTWSCGALVMSMFWYFQL